MTTAVLRHRAEITNWAETLPPAWTIEKVSRLLFDGPRNGVSPSLATSDAGVPSCSISAVRDGRLLIGEDETKWVAASPEDVRQFNIRAGDLFLVRGNGNVSLVGRCGLATEAVPGHVYPDLLMRLRCRRGVSASYLSYAFNSSVAREQIEAAARTTVGTYKINNEQVRQILLPRPPEAVQIEIARFLDRKTAAIDALIVKKERLVVLLQEKRQALITQAITKGLDPKVPMKDSGIEWIGEIPSHWSVARVKHVARLESGHTPSRTVPEHWLDSNDIPWVSLNDTKTLAANDYISDTAFHINELGLQNSSARLLPPRVVVFTRDATIGKAAITTRAMAVSQHIIAWVCGPRVWPEYLLRVFYSMERYLEKFTFGATIRTIGMDDVGTLVTPVPPVGEQKAIAERAHAESTKLDRSERAVVKQIELLREYRQALITSAVTGKLDLSKEPA